MRGIRKRVTYNGKPIYIVKTKQWDKNSAVIRQNLNSGEVYIIAHPYRTKQKNWPAIVAHEIGHIDNYYSWHWLNELSATFLGWWRVGHITGSTFWDAVCLVWWARRYIFQWRK
jgi:hypothetical protein